MEFLTSGEIKETVARHEGTDFKDFINDWFIVGYDWTYKIKYRVVAIEYVEHEMAWIVYKEGESLLAPSKYYTKESLIDYMSILEYTKKVI